MITLLAVSMVASKAISTPLELVVLSVIKLSIVEFVSSVSSIFLTASLKVSVMFESIATPVAESAGLKVITGAVESVEPISRAVKVAEPALIALPEVSSTVVPIAT